MLLLQHLRAEVEIMWIAQLDYLTSIRRQDLRFKHVVKFRLCQQVANGHRPVMAGYGSGK
jgi:hypothetical protein